MKDEFKVPEEKNTQVPRSACNDTYKIDLEHKDPEACDNLCDRCFYNYMCEKKLK